LHAWGEQSSTKSITGRITPHTKSQKALSRPAFCAKIFRFAHRNTTRRRHRHVSSSVLIEEGINVALPPRVFSTLYETSVRWDCSIADIAGWADVGKLKIKTGIGLVRCGNVSVAGRVTLSPMDLLPLFRRSGTGPSEGMMRRIMPPDSSQWLIITEPVGGIAVAVADMLILAEDVFAFEDDHHMVRKPPSGGGGNGGGALYDWDGMNLALIVRIHNDGLPLTQADLIAEMQHWFADQSNGTKMPDSRSIRRRITPIWNALH